MNSLLLSYDEAVDIISCVKWGLSTGLISGISHADLDSMYFATKDGYLDYMCNSFPFEFEPDVQSDVNLQLKRLRAAVIQQTFEGITNEKSVS
jgi:protein arginine kinase